MFIDILFVVVGGSFVLIQFCLYKRLITINNTHKTSFKLKRNRFILLHNKVKSGFNDDVVDNKFSKAGVNINSIKYNYIRYIILFAFLALIIFTYFINDNSGLRINLVLIIIAFFITSPKDKFLLFSSPFNKLMGLLTSYHKNKIDREFYRIFCQLYNASLTGESNHLSSIKIIENIKDSAVITKPYWSKYLNHTYTHKLEKAKNVFLDINSELSKDILNIILKLECLNPSDMRNEISNYVSSFKSKRLSIIKNAGINKSNIVFFIAITTVFLMMFNIVIISIMHPLQMLTYIPK